MSLTKKLVFASAVTLASILGCDVTPNQPNQPANNAIAAKPRYFAQVPMYGGSGMAITNGDFDGDGDLDIIVANYVSQDIACLYLFKNDGKGNFYQGD